MKYYILILLTATCIYFILSGDNKKLFNVILFSITLNFQPLRDYDILISFGGILIVVLFPFYIVLSRGVKIDINIIYCMVAIIVLSFIVGGFYEEFSDERFDNNWIELLNVAGMGFVCVIFYIMLVDYFFKEGEPLDAMTPFIAAIFLHAFAMINSIYLFMPNAPDFLMGSVVVVLEKNFGVDGDVYRYGALMGDYELIVDYCLMVICFSLALLIGKKAVYFPSAAILVAIYVGFGSGTRSFFVNIVLALIIGYFLYIKYIPSMRKSISAGFFVLIALCVLVFINIDFADEVNIFTRLANSMDNLMQGNSLESTVNRNYHGAIKVIYENIGIFGGGAYYFNEISGSEIVSHNVFIAIFLRYGIFGIIFAAYVIIFYSKEIIVRFNLSRNNTEIAISILFLILGCVVFVQQMKVSALRSTSGMLMYTFLFCLFFSFGVKRAK